MALQRSLYSTQFLTLELTEGGSAADVVSGLPVQSASIERTIPTEDVLVLGKLGSMGRQQKEVESVKMDIKIFWASGTRSSSSSTVINSANDGSGTRLTADHLSTLTGNALSGVRSKIVLSPNGFTGFGILTNFGIDAGVGDFLSATLSFAGIGTPVIANAATNPSSESSYAPASVFVYTSENVSLSNSTNETIKSAKFSIDLPNERLSTLGAPVTGLQTDSNITGSHLLVAKPPFKVSVSYEGQLVTGAHAEDQITFGHLKITPIASAITTQSYNQNAGDVGAAMSFASEGTNCTFAAA